MSPARRGWIISFAATTTMSLFVPGSAWATPDGAECPPAKGRPAPAEGRSLANRLLLDHDVETTQEGGVAVDVRAGLLDPDGDARGARTRVAATDVDSAVSDTRFALFDSEDAASGRVAVNIHDVDDVDRDIVVNRLDRDCAGNSAGGLATPATPGAAVGSDERSVEDDGAYVFGG